MPINAAVTFALAGLGGTTRQHHNSPSPAAQIKNGLRMVPMG